MIDLHVHTSFSFDSNEPAENYICEAKKQGENVIGFSEHYDYDAVLDGANITVADLFEYTKKISRLKSENDIFKILCGIEFGYRNFAVLHYRELIERYDFDYVINSVHTLAGRGDCFHDRFFEGRPLNESYSDYLKAVLESVKADFDFQIIGHIGYVTRYRNGVKLKYEDFSDIIDEILREITKRDKCLEINSSVGSSGSRFLPDTDIILRYLQLGGKLLSYGSDAHSVEKYGKMNAQTADFLKSAGVKELYYYEKRRPIAYKI